MLNIIKNSFIMFYKYLPILIPLGLILPICLHLYPADKHPYSAFITAFFSSIAIFLCLSSPKKISYYKTLHFWLTYLISFSIIKLINDIAGTIFFEIGVEKLLFYSNILYNKTGYIILEILTVSYIAFRLRIILYMIVKQEKITISNIKKITYAPYWKIILLTAPFEIISFYFMTIIEEASYNIILKWGTDCIFYCLIVCFYKAKKEGRI